MPTARPHAEIVELQYLRALAVLMVVVGHLHQAGGRFTGADLLGGAGYVGFGGVDVFFVISGFIIHTLYRSASGPSLGFALKRLNRIFPLYWIFTGLAVLGYLVMGDSLTRAFGELDWVSSLTLLPTGQPPLLLVGWTLTHELYFYLVYGLALFLPRRWRLVAAGSLAGLTGLAMADIIQPDTPWARLALSGFNLQFLAGIVLAEWRLHLPATRWLASAIALAGVALGIGWTASFGLEGLADSDRRALIFLPMAVGLVWAILAWQPRWPQLLTAIGDWSYAIYLGHLLAISVLGRVLAMLLPQGLPATLLLFGLGLAASLILGALVHRFLEQPLLATGKAWIRRVAAPDRPLT